MDLKRVVLCREIISVHVSTFMTRTAFVAGWPYCRGHDSSCEQGHTPGIRLWLGKPLQCVLIQHDWNSKRKNITCGSLPVLQAASLLKKTEGVVTLVVCNPNKVKEEEKKAADAEVNSATPALEPSAAATGVSPAPKEPEKPSESHMPPHSIHFCDSCWFVLQLYWPVAVKYEILNTYIELPVHKEIYVELETICVWSDCIQRGKTVHKDRCQCPSFMYFAFLWGGA